ncbi:phage tail tape measure protein [Helicobacter sp. 12S02232-10]|uniref:phage tail tape measure protein n=1 Tax=Helicobacter sp. 12S02232-10 TaxID=1476197 RepID=UPI000BA5A98C|nr:phage tail tape measure protein [Helicobacter sp. 12S02232-10]PAF49205.1 phage tail tape measure protein [Helicobacter sp. 12S02232-10]
MNSEIILDIKANLDDLNKSISRVAKATKLDLGLNLKKSIEEATKGLKLGLKNNMPTNEINELKSKLRQATKMELDLKLDKATNQLKNLIPQAIGTYMAFKGLISKPVSASLDFNTAINEINKFSNFSHKELEGFKKDMFGLGKSNGMDLKDILKMGELSAQLGVAKNDLKDFTQNAINLKIGLGMTQDEAVNLSSGISKAFNLNIKDLNIFGDEVTQMAQSTGQSAKKILEITKATSAGAKAFGLSAKETSALSTAFLSVGLDSSEASSSINKFFTELNNIDNASEGFKQSLEKMGLDAEILKEDIQSNPQEAIKDLLNSMNGLDDEERFGVISEIFGKKMANNINSAKDGVKAFEKALESSKDSTGALQKAVDRAAGDGFGDSIFMLDAAWTELKATIGDIFIPTLKSMFDIFREGLSWLSETIKNSPVTEFFIKWGVGGLIAAKSIGLLIVGWRAFGTLIFYPFQRFYSGLKLLMLGTTKATIKNTIFNNSLLTTRSRLDLLNTRVKTGTRSIFGFLGSLMTGKLNIFSKGLSLLKISFISFGNVLKIIGAGIRFFSLTLLTSPIGWIGLALAGVALLIYKFWKPIKAFFIGLFDGMKGAIEPLKATFLTLWNSIKTAFAPLAPLFSKLFSQADQTNEEFGEVASMGKIIGEIFGWVLKAMLMPFELLIKGISLAIEGIGKLTNWFSNSAIGKWLLGDDKEVKANLNQNKTNSITYQGLIDETLAKRNENQQKMLSQIANNDNSRQINDYKNITIHTNAQPQAIAQAINDYSYDDDF